MSETSKRQHRMSKFVQFIDGCSLISKREMTVVCHYMPPFTLRRENLNLRFHSENTKYFAFTLRQSNLKAQQSPVILDLCRNKVLEGNEKINTHDL